jgi:hypothetical protein
VPVVTFTEATCASSGAPKQKEHKRRTDNLAARLFAWTEIIGAPQMDKALWNCMNEQIFTGEEPSLKRFQLSRSGPLARKEINRQ